MRFISLAPLILGAMAALPLAAQDQVFKSAGTGATLIELYSSEGCSSCPPAEAWLSGLTGSPRLWHDLYPVAFHVDYWDGLGWPDRFARPAYTQRQRDYAARLGQDSVYTPEFIASGCEWRGWFAGSREPPPPQPTEGELTLAIAGRNEAEVTYRSSPHPRDGCRINLAWLGLDLVSDVQRGENQGRRLRHDFIVLNFSSKLAEPAALGILKSGPVKLGPTDAAPAAVVAWVSSPDGKILQVTGGPLP